MGGDRGEGTGYGWAGLEAGGGATIWGFNSNGATTSIFFCTKTSRPHSDFEFRMWMRSGRRIEFASGFGAGRKDWHVITLCLYLCLESVIYARLISFVIGTICKLGKSDTHRDSNISQLFRGKQLLYLFGAVPGQRRCLKMLHEALRP